jgi:C4-dicarboxylate-specific signal transduction histidine kinase
MMVARSRAVVVVYVGVVLGASAGVVLLAGRVPALALGLGLALVLLALGAFVLGRRRREASASTLRYRDIMPVYMSVQDRSYRILESNERFDQDFGDRVGECCYRAYKGRDSICPGCPVERTFVDGQVHSSEETVVTRDGKSASMIVHSVPILDEKGYVTSVMEVSTNITEVKRMQRQLALMGLAVAGTAHRIKNLLMGLEGGIFVVNTGFETKDEATIAEGWEMVERNVSNVSRIVKDLLYCSKEREPRFEENVSLDEIVREAHALFRARAEAEGIELRIETQGEGRGRFDREALLNLITNLCANAIDACRFDPAPDKGGHRVTLRCHCSNGADAVIEVEDDGMGIPEDARVFENFFSTKGTEGTGLGLLVVQKIAEEHGGSASYTSRPGKGTTFRVVLPRAARARAELAS